MSIKTQLKQSLWSNNPALVQLIGLCPLMAVSNSFANAFLLGICTIVVMLASMVAIAFLRIYIKVEVRLSIFVILIVVFTSLIELALQILSYEMYLVIGLFVPLITTNCLLLARAEAFASKNNIKDTAIDALFMGLGFFLVLIVLGGVRELLGSGTLFVNMHQVLPFWSKTWTIVANFTAITLFILPPGGFLILGLMLALQKLINQKLAKKQQTTIKQSQTENATNKLAT